MIHLTQDSTRALPETGVADEGRLKAHVACQDFSFFYGDNQAVETSRRISPPFR